MAPQHEKETKRGLRRPTEIEVAEGSLVALAVIAGAILVGEPFFPEWTHAAREALMPIFVCSLVIHLLNLRRSMIRTFDKHSEAVTELARTVRLTRVRAFANQSEFHAYLRIRFESADRIEVTHFSARHLSMHDDEYHKISDDFIRRGGKYHRIICESLDPEVWRDQQQWLKRYEARQFFLHYLRDVAVDNMKLLDIMIIDSEEVCFGGGYQSGFEFPVISIQSEDVARFYSDYYRHLEARAPRLTIDDITRLQRLEHRKRLTWRSDKGPTGHTVTKSDGDAEHADPNRQIY